MGREEFHNLVRQDAETVIGRQETDSIDIIDEIRSHLHNLKQNLRWNFRKKLVIEEDEAEHNGEGAGTTEGVMYNEYNEEAGKEAEDKLKALTAMLRKLGLDTYYNALLFFYETMDVTQEIKMNQILFHPFVEFLSLFPVV